jgi:hypothetical protein
MTSELIKPITMDQATLEKTPGYQFNLTQGLKATQNAAAARGLGISGAALKGAANYATGLADSTYQNQFNNAVTNQANAFNRLLSMSGQGQTAVETLGNAGLGVGGNIAGNTIGAGNATAGGLVGAGNSLGNAYGNYQANNFLSKMMSTEGQGGINWSSPAEQSAYNLNNAGYGNAAYNMLENMG